ARPHEVVALAGLELVPQVDAGDQDERGPVLHLVAEEVVGAAVRIGAAGTHATLADVPRRTRVAIAARRPVRLERVRGTGVRRPVAALGDVARIGRGPADRRALPVRRTGVVDAVAVLGDVTRPRRRPADRRALPVRRTVVAEAVAALGRVAGSRRRPADERAGRTVHGVRRAVGARPRAVLRDVARARRGAAGDGRRREEVGGTVVGHAVAALGDVARPGGRPAKRGALRVVRTARARSGAVLRRVTPTGRGATFDRGRQEAVGRTVVADAVAALGDVADVGRGTTLEAALEVGGTRGVRPGAGLREVAHARRCAAHRPRGQQRIARAVRARPRTVLGNVAVTRRRAAHRRGRLEDVGRTCGSAARAVLRGIAWARGAAALDRARQEPVRRARSTGAVAELRLVTVAGRRTTEGARRQEGIRRTRRGSSAA